jgi:hypothetical protein
MGYVAQRVSCRPYSRNAKSIQGKIGGVHCSRIIVRLDEQDTTGVTAAMGFVHSPLLPSVETGNR